MNTTKINQIKKIEAWSNTNFHGNRKKVGLIPVNEFKTIVAKKRNRERLKYIPISKSELIKELLNNSLKAKGTPYFKTMIEGNTGIYYASPAYGHSDYNKTRLFDKTPANLIIMEKFNKIVNK